MSSHSSDHSGYGKEKGKTEDRASSSERNKSEDHKEPRGSPREYDKPPRPPREHRNGDDAHPKREERKRLPSVSDDAANDGKTIYISQLNMSTEEHDIQTRFRTYGEIVNLDLIRNHVTHQSKCFCFVTYATQEQAQLAIREMNNQDLQGVKLRVEIAHRQKPRRKTPGKYFGRNERGEEQRFGGSRHRRHSPTPSPDERDYFGDKHRPGDHKRPRNYEKGYDREQNYDPERIHTRDSFPPHSRHKFYQDDRDARRESNRERHGYSHREKSGYRDEGYSRGDDRGPKYRQSNDYHKYRPSHRHHSSKEDSRPHYDSGDYKDKPTHERRKYSKNKSKSPQSSPSPR